MSFSSILLLIHLDALKFTQQWSNFLTSLTTTALLPTPGQTIHHTAQQSVLQGEKTILLLGEVMDQIFRFAPEHHLTQNNSLYQIIQKVSSWSQEWIMCTLCDDLRCLLGRMQVWSGLRRWKGRRLPWGLHKGLAPHRLFQMHPISSHSCIWKIDKSAA